jgi:hypothetical protein
MCFPRMMCWFTFTAILLAHQSVSAFRGCGNGDSDAWSATTKYTIGELVFDNTTGMASGRETIYNYSNSYDALLGECHVTYELSGNYVSGVEFFLLDGTRSSYSNTCPDELLETEFPPDLLFSIQMQRTQDGSVTVTSTSSGQHVARGSWTSGSVYYKTDEQCQIF